MDELEFAQAQEVPEGVVCENCGTEQGAVLPKICGQCGAEMQPEQAFCPRCGWNAAVGTPKKKNNKKLLLALAGVALVIVLVIVIAVSCGSSKQESFYDLFGYMEANSWCTIASDDSYIKIDTNPTDMDKDDFTYSYYINVFNPATEAIEEINQVLGFSDALMEKMNTTTWSQGRQTESNEKYTVSWTYHPDKGLEVVYERNK